MNEIKANKRRTGRCCLPSFGWPAAMPAWRGDSRCVRVAVAEMDGAERGAAAELSQAVLVRKAAARQPVQP